MSNLSIILWISVAVQCLAAVLALRLIPLTRRAWAWIILSVAFLLMATRRALSLLYQEGIIKAGWLEAFSTEIVALAISFLTVAGVVLIRKIFIHLHDDAEKIRTLSLAVEQSPGVIIIINKNGAIEYVNAAYCSLSGYTLNDVLGVTPDILNPELVNREVLSDIWDTLNSGNIWEGEVRNKYNDGYLRWENARVSPVKDEIGKITHYVILLEDVTKQKEHRKELEHMAMHDALTSLPNRTLFIDRLKQAILVAQRDKQPLTVMLMDINSFKEINDTMGHQAGDEILKEIATRLLEIIRGGDTVARMGGDEFLILLPASNPSKQLLLHDRISTIMDIPFRVGNTSFEVKFSVGVAVYPEDGDEPETLLKHAEVAMYSAKSTKQAYVRYDKSIDAGNFTRLELSHSLRKAVAQNQFVLHFQPIVNFSTASIDNFEALIRWNHPARGLLYPDTFIPLAEQSNQIGAITQWVIKNAIGQLALWGQSGISTGISLNISANDLLDPDLSGLINDELCTHKIRPSQVTIEITESALMIHTQQTTTNLHRLRSIGVKINIDDFGTGYSSLQYLTKLPLTGLKIDKAFVMNMTSVDNDAIIVRSTTDLAHNMGMTVVAEGIENQDAYDVLEILGVDYGQGYHLAKPMSADKVPGWLDQWYAASHRTGVRPAEVKYKR